jgi:hypothetical protein
MTLRRCAAYGVVTVVLGIALAPAAHAQYPPTSSTGRVTAGRVTPGGCVTFSGDGFAGEVPIAVSDNGTTVQSVESDTAGLFSTSVCPTVLGVHLLRATGEGANGASRTVTAEVTVVASLSTTGANDVLPTVGAGAALVALGAAIVYVARRRRVVRFS